MQKQKEAPKRPKMTKFFRKMNGQVKSPRTQRTVKDLTSEELARISKYSDRPMSEVVQDFENEIASLYRGNAEFRKGRR